MNENSDLLPNLLHDEFELQMRGYSRRQVDEFVARRNNEIRDLEQRLARALDESDHLRREISAVRQQALAGRPAHEEVSERIAQILKLADDEAKAQKGKAEEDIAKLRSEAQQESDRVRADAREQAERMLTAAQEQAERTISAARSEADKTRTTARAEADRLTAETRKKADAAMSNAKAQAKKVLDEATARSSAIHDGAERRLNLLSTRHAETVRRLTDILDGVQGLVAAEAARMSLEEEVNQSVSNAITTPALEPGDGDTEQAGKAAGPGRNLELATLAPPAPETLAGTSGAPGAPGALAAPASSALSAPPFTAAPPHGGQTASPLTNGGSRPAQPGSPATGDEDLDGSKSVPAGLHPGGMSGGTPPPPPVMPRRLGVPAPDSATTHDAIAMPAGPAGGSTVPGPGIPPSAVPNLPPSGPGGLRDLDALPDRDGRPEREGRHEGKHESKRGDNRASHTGLIDPDEPTEGIRLMR
jgi:cell division septum initiation protein DivIVA